MINLIDHFFDQIETQSVFMNSDDRSSDYTEVYFFMGRDAILCISKPDERVMANIKYNELQINIISQSQFSLTASGRKNLFFYLETGNEVFKKRFEPKEAREEKKHRPEFKTEPIKKVYDEKYKYKYKSVCENCNSKKCSQYDTINGRKFDFGKGEVSEDLMQQYDKYCQTKIEKFNCLSEK